MFTGNQLFWGLALIYGVIVMSCIGCLYLFWYAWKRRPIAILWYQLDILGGSVFKFTGGGNHPLLSKPCYRKRLGKIRELYLCGHANCDYFCFIICLGCKKQNFHYFSHPLQLNDYCVSQKERVRENQRPYRSTNVSAIFTILILIWYVYYLGKFVYENLFN